MPAVAEAVVVAAPDARLGERAAAVLRIRDGHDMPTLDDVRAHFEAAGVAMQKWPEELHQSRRLSAYRERQGAEIRACRRASIATRAASENRILSRG